MLSNTFFFPSLFILLFFFFSLCVFCHSFLISFPSHFFYYFLVNPYSTFPLLTYYADLFLLSSSVFFTERFFSPYLPFFLSPSSLFYCPSIWFFFFSHVFILFLILASYFTPGPFFFYFSQFPNYFLIPFYASIFIYWL